MKAKVAESRARVVEAEAQCQPPAKGRGECGLSGMDEQTTPLEGKNPLLAVTFEAQLDGELVLRPGLFGSQAHGGDPRLNSLTFRERKSAHPRMP